MCTQLGGAEGRTGREQLAVWRAYTYFPGKEEKPLRSPTWERRKRLCGGVGGGGEVVEAKGYQKCSEGKTSELPMVIRGTVAHLKITSRPLSGPRAETSIPSELERAPDQWL